MPENVICDKLDGIITKKKFFALNLIKDKYEYAIVIDSETEFIRNVNIEDVCKEYFKNKVLLGNRTIFDLTGVKNSCKKYFSDCIGNHVLDSELYLWFNQPCIYEMSTLNDFFEKINYNKNIKKFTWYDFDYYIYMYYLILYKNFEIKDIGIVSRCGVFEEFWYPSLIFVNDNWKKFNIYLCQPELKKKFDNNKLFMIIQKDKKMPKFRILRKIISWFIPVKELRHKLRGG